MGALKERKLLDALRDYVAAGDRPFLGICLGLQLLFEGSEENGGVEGLGIIPGKVERFDESKGLPIPHIGWNDLKMTKEGKVPPLLSRLGDRRVYFVHSFRATPSPANAEWVAATSEYAGEFVAALSKGTVTATQFHPGKSGAGGARRAARLSRRRSRIFLSCCFCSRPLPPRRRAWPRGSSPASTSGPTTRATWW